jgi:regulatory protein
MSEDENMQDPEVDIILKQLRSKYYNKDFTDYTQLQKVKASLYRKGFLTDNINKALDIVINEQK